MAGVGSKKGFRRGGLFAKYVMSLVGLVLFVLTVNGAIETWISYRATRAALSNAMSDKAAAAAMRIEQLARSAESNNIPAELDRMEHSARSSEEELERFCARVHR